LSRAVETGIEYVVGNAKFCFTSLKAHRIVTPKHLEAEKLLREWFPIIFVHRFMWNINMAQFFRADFVFCMKPTPFFFFGWPNAMLLAGFAGFAICICLQFVHFLFRDLQGFCARSA